MKTKKKAVVKWFTHKVHTGWHKSQSLAYRRRLVREAHGGKYLTSARSLMALSSVSKDPATKRLALADARYFFRMHEKYKK